MRIIFLILSVLFISQTQTPAQNYNWIEPGRTYIKFFVYNDGMHRIERSDFSNAGIDPSGIDPRTIKIFYKGIEIPCFVNGESNGNFDPDDYIDVFCERNYGGIHTFYNNTTPVYQKDEYYSFYSDTSAYWIEWGGSNGLRYNTSQLSSNTPYQFPYFIKSFHAEQDNVYSLGEKRSSSDFRNFSNELVIGEGWYWRDMQRTAFVADTFFISSLNQDQQNFQLKLFAYPNTASTSIFNEHILVVRVNGNIVDSLKRNDYDRFDTTINLPTNLLQSNAYNIINLTYTGPPGYLNGRTYFDFFTSFIPQNFRFHENHITFESQVPDSASRIFKIAGYNSSNEVSIYDVKNGYRIMNYTVSADTVIFTGKGNGRFEILNRPVTQKPKRFVQRNVPDLVSGSNGADYVIVYNNLFESQAEQLRVHRQNHDGFRSVKAEIQDVYDIFNFGIEDPIAVKRFMNHIYSNWQQPTVRYLCLFGRGSTDPKKNLVNSQFYQNRVPVWGNPITDGYFVNFVVNTFFYNHQIAVGRLPVYTSDEAQIAVDKIISYDQQPISKWNKTHTFITGGFEPGEQARFAGYSNNFINSYISSNPIRGNSIRIFRSDTTGQVTFNYQDSILKAINNGTLMVNYIGHAATSFWDNGIEDPSIVNNTDKYTVINSFTCFTGRNAETVERGFGEKFVLLPGKGSIGFIGSTGWSFEGTGNTLNGNVFRAYSQDNLRAFGDILKKAGDYLIPNANSFNVRNMVNCYNLLGDPAQKLKLPLHPEFELDPTDYVLSNPYPSLREDVKLSVAAFNFGVNADSVKVNFKLRRNNQLQSEFDTVVYNLGFIDTVAYTFSMDSLGVYVMHVEMDPDRWYPQDNPDNNKIEIPIPLRNISFVPVKPVDNQAFASDSVEFTGLNPGVDPFSNSVSVILQIDTTPQFNSSIRQTYFNNNISGVSSSFKTAIAIRDSNIIYYWRMNAVVNQDSSGWSEIRRFVYNEAVQSKNFRSSNFTDRDLPEEVTVYKNKAGQYSQNELQGVEFSENSGGLTLSNFSGRIFARSFGDEPFAASYFTVNNEEFYLIGNEYLGFNFAKLRKIDGHIIEVKNFRNTDSLLSGDSIVNYLNTFNNSHILVAVLGYPANQNLLHQNVKNKLRGMGSNAVDSIPNFLSRWCFISVPDNSGGYKTAEGLYRYTGTWNPVSCELNTEFQNVQGSITQMFGPANGWNNISWQRNSGATGNTLSVDIFGVRKNGTENILFGNLTSQTEIDLSGIDAFEYIDLKVVTKMAADSVNPVNLPVFGAVKLHYTPPGELIPDQNSMTSSHETILFGDTVSFAVDLYNIGFSDYNGIVNKWSFISQSGGEVIKFDTLFSPLEVGQMVNCTYELNSSDLLLPPSLTGIVNVVYESKPLGRDNQYFEFNDIAFTNFLITPDTLTPKLDITYDGATVRDGDYIASNPYIKIIFSDDGMEPINPGDTLLVRIKLNNQFVPYFIGSELNPEISIEIFESFRPQMQVNYKPNLQTGTNRFEFITRDKAGNAGDSVFYRLTVNPEMRIKDLANYPNPMRDRTEFMFTLSGGSVPGKCRVKIFTVAGRLIKTIESPANIGYNKIEWDGRDNDGDMIANGVYLYRVFVEGSEGLEAATQKLVILK